MKYILLIILWVVGALKFNAVSQANYTAVKVPEGIASQLTTVGASLGTLANPSAIRFIKINADNTVTARTAAEMLSDIGAQTLAANLTSIANLANANGYLKNNGSGAFTYETPAGAGTVTNTGTLTSNALVLGNGTSDTKVVTGITSDGISILNLGVDATTAGKLKLFGGTSGNATIQTAAAAGTNVVITLPVVTSTLLPNTSTSGVATSPTASGTETITHNLGRVPTIIRIYGIGAFVNSTSATPTPFSMGVFNSTGNRCVYMTSNGTTAQASQTSTVFAVFLATSAGNTISGVINNVTSTGFDITWTETGTSAAQNYIWECQ